MENTSEEEMDRQRVRREESSGRGGREDLRGSMGGLKKGEEEGRKTRGVTGIFQPSERCALARACR